MCFFSAPSAPAIAPAPTESEAEVLAAELRERERARRARGRAATILTGGLGDTTAAPVAPKTLLGA